MSLGVSIEVVTAPPKGGPRFERVADEIIQDRLWDAVGRIRTWWPVDTGRSLGAWTVKRDGLMRFRVINEASEEGQEYAGYVFRKGDPTRTPLAETRVRDEILAAVRQIRLDMERFRVTGEKAALPTLRESVVDQLRDAIRQRLVASSLRRIIRTRALLAA